MDLFGNKTKTEGTPEQGQKQGMMSGLMGGNKPAPFDPSSLEKDLNTLARKLRINEDRTVDVRKKTQLLEHNMLSSHKKIINEIRFLNQELSEMKRNFEDLKVKLLSVGREMGQLAKKEDVAVLEKYINMWEPINFVTRKEVEKIIEEK